MTQEDKDLLLKDLCARLPYGVLVHYCNKSHTLYTNEFILNERLLLEFRTPDCCVELKPYLRSMSDMTEEEKKEMYHDCYIVSIDFDMRTTDMIAVLNSIKIVDWLNTHHFDYRNLIEKGLAIEATKDNNPYN